MSLVEIGRLFGLLNNIGVGSLGMVLVPYVGRMTGVS